ncbi:MAG: PEP/pyruvate-binding domain-containing protein, partial [Anaerolineales bacterium]
MLLSLNSSEISLENAGGKALNLARLTRAGFNVPPGFVLPTSAYREFVSENALAQEITRALADVADVELQALEGASEIIRSAFSLGRFPPDIKNALQEVLHQLEEAPLAVRSSATAEDLPDLSFAGQQDTYLNVIGETKLIKAVVGCWSSLWTA